MVCDLCGEEQTLCFEHAKVEVRDNSVLERVRKLRMCIACDPASLRMRVDELLGKATEWRNKYVDEKNLHASARRTLAAVEQQRDEALRGVVKT